MYTHTHTRHLGFCFGFLTGKIQSSIKGYNLLLLLSKVNDIALSV